jgi:hypothetical protein
VRLEDRVRPILVYEIGQDRIDYAELDSGIGGKPDTPVLGLLDLSPQQQRSDRPAGTGAVAGGDRLHEPYGQALLDGVGSQARVDGNLDGNATQKGPEKTLVENERSLEKLCICRLNG